MCLWTGGNYRLWGDFDQHAWYFEFWRLEASVVDSLLLVLGGSILVTVPWISLEIVRGGINGQNLAIILGVWGFLTVPQLWQDIQSLVFHFLCGKKKMGWQAALEKIRLETKARRSRKARMSGLPAKMFDNKRK